MQGMLCGLFVFHANRQDQRIIRSIVIMSVKIIRVIFCSDLLHHGGDVVYLYCPQVSG